MTSQYATQILQVMEKSPPRYAYDVVWAWENHVREHSATAVWRNSPYIHLSMPRHPDMLAIYVLAEAVLEGTVLEGSILESIGLDDACSVEEITPEECIEQAIQIFTLEMSNAERADFKRRIEEHLGYQSFFTP